jgi:hypothetical protein
MGTSHHDRNSRTQGRMMAMNYLSDVRIVTVAQFLSVTDIKIWVCQFDLETRLQGTLGSPDDTPPMKV